MTALSPDAEKLLDMICSAADARAPIRALRGRADEVLGELVRAGLVDGLLPTATGRARWLDRNAPGDSRAAAGAQPGCSRGKPGVFEKARRFEEQRAAKAQQARRATCPPGPISGPALEAELRAWALKRGASIAAVAYHLFGSSSRLDQLKGGSNVTPATEQRVRNFMANPPPREEWRSRPAWRKTLEGPRNKDEWRDGKVVAEDFAAWALANGYSPSTLAYHVLGSGSALARMARRQVQPKVVAKLEAFKANPVPPNQIRRRKPSVKPDQPMRGPPTLESEARLRHLKLKAGRDRTRAKAERLLEKGVTPANQNAAVRLAMKAITEARVEEARAVDPVEIAKLTIRRAGHVCFDAVVHLGEKKGKGKFFVNRKLVDKNGLLEFAIKVSSK